MDMATTLEAPSAAAALGYDGGLTCAISVTNLDAAIAWYQDVLGMRMLYRVDEIAWCEFESPVARVNIGLSQVEAVPQGGGATLTFGVTDIDVARGVLDAAGVRQDGPVQEIPGMVKLLTFYDPDGNALMLYQDLSRQG